MKQLLRLVPRIEQKQALFVLIGIALGILLFGLIRFVAQPAPTHYHANFAVFINGQRQEFKGAQYYEEIASCSAEERPAGRVHMHDNVNHVVHVHEKLMTWGNFFTVLGLSLTDKAYFDGERAFVDGRQGNLRFVLNDKPVLTVANKVIESEDRLLISFGSEDSTQLQQQFAQIITDAGDYNRKQDPAACRGSQEGTVWNRLRKAVWF